MKQDWEIKKLGEVCEMYQPKTISTKEMVVDGLYPVFGANGIIGKYKKYNHEEPQLLITCRGATCGAVNISEPKSWINGNAMVVRPKDQSIDLKFLEYLFRGGIDLSKTITGAAQPQITRQSLIPLKISYPKSLTEQQRIVAILDRCFSAIDRAKAIAEQNLKNAKELFESYLQGVFERKGEDWDHTRLGDICQIKDGTHFSPKNSGVGEFMYITAKNIKPYYIDLSNISYVSENDHKEIYSRCSPKKGDVLYIKDGATAGIATINTFEEEFSMLSSVALLKCSDRILNTFLVHYMNSSIGKKNFLGYIDGAAITRLTLVKIKNVCLPLPPLKEQQTIVRQLDALRSETQRLEKHHTQKIADLDELKKSILQKAFNGELRTAKLETV
jgi:type I restriction enzyme S subunit